MSGKVREFDHDWTVATLATNKNRKNTLSEITKFAMLPKLPVKI